MKLFILFCMLLSCLAGCAAPLAAPEPLSPAANAPSCVSSAPESALSRALPLENAYIAALADNAAAPILAEKLPPVEEIRAAYHFILEHTYFADPVGLDSWRFHSDPSRRPSYVENRALSPLAYGVGSCEDFAAALVALLTRMGYEARYVSGLTISVDGAFVDHAWVVARLDGVWYHLDPQLEQNVTRNGLVTYRYFLKSDAFLLADHRWGENLIAYWSGAISPEQAETIRQTMTPPLCPKDFTPAPGAQKVSLPARPDISAIQRNLDAEKAAFEAANGPLSPLELEIRPPILALMPKQ